MKTLVPVLKSWMMMKTWDLVDKACCLIAYSPGLGLNGMDDPGLCIDKVRNNMLIKCWGIIVIIIIFFYKKESRGKWWCSLICRSQQMTTPTPHLSLSPLEGLRWPVVASLRWPVPVRTPKRISSSTTASNYQVLELVSLIDLWIVSTYSAKTVIMAIFLTRKIAIW